MSDVVERMKSRIADWDEEEPRADWWTERREYAEAAETILALRKELDEAKGDIIAFAGPSAVSYALDHGMPDGHLHPVHYDILAKAGARMDDFTRADIAEQPA